MFINKQTKEKLKTDILNHKSVVTIGHYDCSYLLKEVLKEDPRLLVYINSIRTSSSIDGAKIYFDYANTDVDVTDIEIARNNEKLERILHHSIGKLDLIKYVVVDKSVNVERMSSDFRIKYSGFYSNLLNFSCQYCKLSGQDYYYAIFNFRYRIGKVKLGMMENAVKKKVRELAPILFSSDMKEETKVYVAHNYLARTVKYDKIDNPDPLESSYMQSAYGALINQACVCQGYAEAFKRLLEPQGVKCEVICGKVKGSDSYHAWNVVYFEEGDYYHVDVTWDANGGSKIDDYFGLNDEDLKGNRLWSFKHADGFKSGHRNILQEAKQQIFFKKRQYLAQGIDKKYLQ